MPELASLAVGAAFSALATPPVQDAYDGVRKGLVELVSTRSPLSKAVDRALKEAWIGFEGVLRGNCHFDPPAEHRLKSFARDSRVGEALGQLIYLTPEAVDTEEFRAALLEHGPDGADDEVFEDAWRAAKRRFQKSAAESKELTRLVKLASDDRREAREEAELETLKRIERLLAAQETTDGAPGSPEIQNYRQTIYRQHRYADIRGLFRKEGEPVATTIELSEVFVETGLASLQQTREDSDLDNEDVGDEVRGPGLLRLPASESRRAVHEVLADHEVSVVLGRPGSGKSTLLKAIGLSLCLEEERSQLLDPGVSRDLIPLLFPLREYASELLERANTKLEPFFLDRVAHGLPNLQSLLEQGRCLVLFDGLDEVLDVDHRRWVVDEVWELMARFSGNRFVITSRPHGYWSNPFPGPVDCWELQPFDDEAIHRFFRGWFLALARTGGEAGAESDPEQKARDLATEVLERPRLREMAENPLLCTLIVLVHRLRSGRLPHRRVKFLEHAARTLIAEWPRWRRLPARPGQPPVVDLPDADALERGLAEVAWRAYAELGSREIPQSRLEAWLRDYLVRLPGWDEHRTAEALHDLIAATRDQFGILSDVGGDRFQFVHLHLHEYLVAFYIRDRMTESQVQEVLRHFLHHPSWEEILRLLVSGASQAQAGVWLTGILDDPTSELEPRLRRDFRFVCRCLGDETPVDSGFRDRVGKLVSRVLTDEDCVTRVKLLRDIVAFGGDEEVRTVVRGLLHDDSQSVRRSAVEFFTRVGADELGLRDNLRQLLHDDSFLVRGSAVEFLTRVGADELGLRDDLLQLLDDDSFLVRRSALIFFTRVSADDPDLRDDLRQLLHDDSLLLRSSAVALLTRIGADDPNLRDDILRLLHDDSPLVRSSAVDFFALVGADEPNLRDDFRKLLRDDNLLLRSSAVEFFTRVGVDDPDLRDDIRQLLHHEDHLVRRSAVEFFTRIGADEPDLRDDLRQFLHDDDQQVRRSAFDFFTRIGADEPDLHNDFRQLLHDDQSGVRSSAVEFFARVGADEPGLRDDVRQLLHDDDPGVRSSAVEFCARVGADEPDLLNDLRQLLHDNNPFVRSSAVEFFARVGADEPGLRDDFEQLLYDDHPAVRSQTLSFLLREGLSIELSLEIFENFDEITVVSDFLVIGRVSRELGRVAVNHNRLFSQIYTHAGSKERFQLDEALAAYAQEKDERRRTEQPLKE